MQHEHERSEGPEGQANRVEQRADHVEDREAQEEPPDRDEQKNQRGEQHGADRGRHEMLGPMEGEVDGLVA